MHHVYTACNMKKSSVHLCLVLRNISVHIALGALAFKKEADYLGIEAQYLIL